MRKTSREFESKNRVQSPLSSFAARLREFIARSANQSSSNSQALNHEHQFNRLAIELFGLQFRHNHVYRNCCEYRGCSPTNVAHWATIPAVPASAFKELDLTSLAETERVVTFRSSGTTASARSRHHHSTASLALYDLGLLAWFERFLLADARERMIVLSLTPSPESAPDSSLVHMFEVIRHEHGLPDSIFVGDLSTEGEWIVDFEKAIGALRRGSGAVLLLGTAFNFVHLLDYCAEKELKMCLPAGSRVMETGGYKGRSRSIAKSELHHLITDRLGVPPSHIVTEYGMSELSSQAYDAVVGQTSQERVFQFPPWVRVQVISPETGVIAKPGETGLIRVFDLANVWSVMAIQTEDLVVARGPGFDLLGRAGMTEARGCSLMSP